MPSLIMPGFYSGLQPGRNIDDFVKSKVREVFRWDRYKVKVVSIYFTVYAETSIVVSIICKKSSQSVITTFVIKDVEVIGGQEEFLQRWSEHVLKRKLYDFIFKFMMSGVEVDLRRRELCHLEMR